jgi:hypothetical protein
MRATVPRMDQAAAHQEIRACRQHRDQDRFSRVIGRAIKP